MFSRILLATDLSLASDSVVDYMASVRTLGCREVVLAYVIHLKHLDSMSELLREQAAPRLDAQTAALVAQGFEVSVETPVGAPGAELARLAKERGCQAIVVGSHGHSVALDIALGGVATDLVHRAPVPVLIVRLAVFEDEGRPCCRVESTDILSHILYATDFSDNSEVAFQYVEALARSGSQNITLLHVQDIARIRPHLEDKLQEFNEIDRARLERMAARLRDLGVGQIGLEIPYGSPAKEITEFVRNSCVSLVVMGTHGRGYVSELFVGSVSHNVARLSDCPVLVVPPVHR